MDILNDDRVVMTLDAGGTNFVFSAVQGGSQIVEPVTFNSNAHDLTLCLKTIINGFECIKEQLSSDPVAISFAFPGPADYKAGIIGKLPNLPAFNGEGVALGPMLEDHFKIPTFIGNDGTLFAYGEAMAGVLPAINRMLEDHKASRQYANLLGITLGTGFGAGVVVNNTLCDGDNAAGGEIWLTRNFQNPIAIAESSVGARALRKTYGMLASDGEQNLSPQEIFEIAVGDRPGNRVAANHAFDSMALVIAEALCNAITMIDGIVVIGGGLAGAYSLIASKILAHMNGTIQNIDGEALPRLVSKVYDLEDEVSLEQFLADRSVEVTVPFSDRKVQYTEEKRIGIARSRLGTSKAISLGAYAVALKGLAQSEAGIGPTPEEARGRFVL